MSLSELRAVRRIKRADGTYEVRDRSRKHRHADIAEGLASACYRIYLEMTKQQVGLQHANNSQQGAARDILSKLYRPEVGLKNINNF